MTTRARKTRAPDTASVRDAFTASLDALVEQVKQDRSILAAILCGSLSHDTVWAKSDIDLVLVTIDDRKLDRQSMTLYADGVNVHAGLMPRAEFRKLVEGSIRNSFAHSYLAKGRLLYTHDDSIADLCVRLGELGERDTKMQLFRAATHALPSLYKAHKWMITRGDLEYTALWILYTATALARIEILEARQLADREVLPQALKLNPAFFRIIYTDLINAKKTTANVQAALDAVDGYLAQRAATVFAPLIEHLREVGETRTTTEISDYFSRNYGIEDVVTACEYLADQGLIGKAAIDAFLAYHNHKESPVVAMLADLYDTFDRRCEESNARIVCCTPALYMRRR